MLCCAVQGEKSGSCALCVIMYDQDGQPALAIANRELPSLASIPESHKWSARMLLIV